ncbi:MAG: hypothetical protein JWO57_4550 [Pseudonocardiales bacterium]|nr:hypothetical protein [Pseudonocardiales bacterium]
MTHPPPRTRTVAEVAAPYSNFLVRVPRIAIDVCEVCHGPVDDQYPRCYACLQAVRTLGRDRADVVAFVSLAPTGGQMAKELYTYKRMTVPDSLRLPRLTGLAAVLWLWLAKHERCMALKVGATEFDVITTVPSTSGRSGAHPLEHLVSGVVSTSAARYRSVLGVQRTDLAQREFAADRYRVTEDVRRKTMLLIDDTWTTGAHAQAASTP